ncbi:acetyl-CoA synthetase-like protein [Gloeophyllum trabeum ATCC 11539]|uniref:Acetyl-CoA synthetase-like protein n=1 Tax=Gloeophyllum trabeum (strain ATCC 11539 / FP-39264 / Madison 617) TaxID=670483 RepID=S7RUI3_GLOTA|nr:acetyl-CoA synthetase-like protein [Gloeophyllum trabeum ATCC 11539]EPQ58395.1 acetyl-CoA synthetase-like protein [Gloeophyllum trabeum ATCC 11539]
MSLNKQVPFPADLDLKRQSIEVPGTKRPGQTGHYRNGCWGLLPLGCEPNRLNTLLDIYETGYALSKDQPFLGYRPKLAEDQLANHFVWQTYAEVDVRRRAIGSALHALFQSGVLGGGEMDTVGIWSQNRPEWQIIDLALHAYKKIGVSLYDTLGRDSVGYIIRHAHLTVVFATWQHIPTLLKLAPSLGILKLIVCIDDIPPKAKFVVSSWAELQKVQVKELRELEAEGKASPVEPFKVTPNDVASLCYTSGTTSTPKGVVLTHGNLTSAVDSCLHGTGFDNRGVLLSYLPLAHIYERIAELLIISIGGSVGYFSGDPLKLLEDAQILKPNYFPSVPRVLNRVYQSAMVAGNAPGLKGKIFAKALESKLQRLRTTGINTHALWDRLVFRKIGAVLGGNLKMVTCGSAPIAPDVMDFLKIALACDVVEGYGMTENGATCSRVWPNDPTSSGTVGPPQPCNEVKLVDVPAMGYTSEDKPFPRGELCVRGPNCFSGYYKDDKNTKETLDDEGWLHTGDVAAIDDCGRIKLIDRVKNIMKLAQGEYVALEKIENLYSACPLVAQVYVHGDSLQSFLIGVVVPDPVQLASLASDITGKKISPEDQLALGLATRDDRVVDAIMKALDVEAQRNDLKGFETLKRIHVTLDPFTVEDGTLTPTFKIKRKDAYKKFQVELDALYALGEPASSRPSKL